MQDWLFLCLKGMAMGAADVVPGVSGGTIAFISGIYQELIHSLSRCGPTALKILFKEGFASAWRYVNGTFLTVLFFGVLLSLKLLAGLVLMAIEQYPILIWAFFSGLILASIFLLYKSVARWRWIEVFWFLLGAALVVSLSFARPTQLPANGIVLFVSGFIAICAMILPGISGSFILLLLGVYTLVLTAIHELQLMLISSFLAGCVTGLIVFSRFLSWLLRKHRSPTLACLLGFLFGSLNVTWPWKQVVEWMNKGNEQIALVTQNVSPARFEAIGAGDSQLALAVLAMTSGAFLILMIEFFAKNIDTNE